MDASLWISGVVYGLSMGSIFFLLAAGLSLCFGLMRIISLDQLLYYSLGAYVAYQVNVTTGLTWPAMLAGALAAGALSWVVERWVFDRIYAREITFTMITSFGVLVAGVGAIKYVWGLVPRPMGIPVEAQVALLGVNVPVYRLIVIAVAVGVYGLIQWLLNRTIVGTAIRAAVEDVDQVESLGVDVYRLFTTTFVGAGMLSGLAGALHGPLVMVDPQMGLEVVPFVFMVVIIGGLGSLKGTLVSAFLVGQVVSLGSLVYAPLAQMAPFAAMLLILLWKPTGLYGSALLRR